MKRSWLFPCGIILVLVLVLGCVCLGVMGAVGLIAIRENPSEISNFPIEIGLSTPTATPKVVRPVIGLTRPAATLIQTPGVTPQATTRVESTPVVTETPVFREVLTDTLSTLENTNIPVSDLIALAGRLKGVQNVPHTLEPPAAPFQAGARQTFWATNTDTNESFQVQATLRYVTDHLYFWVEDGVPYRYGDLRNLSDTFEKKIYPTDREFFGSEWTPGVDGDPHLYILLARGLGGILAGYYSSADEVPPQAHIYSNAHEMFFLNDDNTNLGNEYTYGVLAHEFQHMIHWNRDRNETTWLNEGFSELAAFLNGYDVGGFDRLYARNPDLQLNDWPGDHSQTGPHYGASFLFLDYFLDRFGEDATKAVVGDLENGMASIDTVLKNLGITDPLTGKAIRADDVFTDWVVASYLQDKDVGDGRYTYHNYSQAPHPIDTEKVGSCPTEPLTRDVRQYGVDYIHLTCQGETRLRFEGSTVVGVIPANPHSGSYAFWSNQGDESDMTLTRIFDFTGHTGPISLSYWTWYDLEKDYDYLYLEASRDGQNWEILRTPSGTMNNPSGNSYGWGYNGLSGNGPSWVQEKVDLSQFAGKEIQLRFEYITDAAVTGEGFLLDDVRIPEIGYTTSFESEDGGWAAQGFVRIENLLPQTFRLVLITRGRQTRVQEIPLSADITAEIPLQIGGDVNDAILVVAGTTRFTRQPAAYRISFHP